MTYLSSITDGVTTTERTVSHDAIGFALDEATYYYVKNIQGDVLCVVNETGAPVLYYTYDAWGSFTVTPAVGASNQEVLLVATLNPATYRGYFYDHELGLYYLQSRYYDPETGRFINADQRFETDADLLCSNIFNYCLNNPRNYTELGET